MSTNVQFSPTKLVASLFARSRSRVTPTDTPEWLGQHRASPARKQRRQIIAKLRRRQGINWIKHARAQQRENRAELARLS